MDCCGLRGELWTVVVREGSCGLLWSEREVVDSCGLRGKFLGIK